MLQKSGKSDEDRDFKNSDCLKHQKNSRSNFNYESSPIYQINFSSNKKDQEETEKDKNICQKRMNDSLTMYDS